MIQRSFSLFQPVKNPNYNSLGKHKFRSQLLPSSHWAKECELKGTFLQPWCCLARGTVRFVPVKQLRVVQTAMLWSDNPPCIAHYKVDILCVYKVGFRSPLYIPTMGGKAVFCARNMPLDLEDDFIATLAFQFIPGWFPTRKRLNICGIPFYRPLVPFKEWP